MSPRASRLKITGRPATFRVTKIVRLLQFGGMPNIDPAFGEDLRHLLLQNHRRHQSLAIEQKSLLDRIVDDVAAWHQKSWTETVAPSFIRCYGASPIVLDQRDMHDTVKDTHWHEPKAGQNAGFGDFRRPKLPV